MRSLKYTQHFQTKNNIFYLSDKKKFQALFRILLIQSVIVIRSFKWISRIECNFQLVIKNPPMAKFFFTRAKYTKQKKL